MDLTPEVLELIKRLRFALAYIENPGDLEDEEVTYLIEDIELALEPFEGIRVK